MSIGITLLPVNEGRAARSIKTRPSRDIERSDSFWPIEYGTASYAHARALRARALRELLRSFARKIAAGVHRWASKTASFLVSIGEANAARRTYEVLSRLSDRQLAEIGLTRGNIPAVAFRESPNADADTRSAARPPEPIERNIREAA